MRKMYFAMIPKKSATEEILTAVVVILAARYGAKKLLGEEKYSEYVEKAKDFILGNTKKDFAAKAPADGVFEEDDVNAFASEGDKQEEDILQRIKKATAKGIRTGVDRIFGEEEE